MARAAAPDDESALVESAQHGSRDAFNELYGRYARLVRGVLLARVEYDEVPDLLQDVFLKAWTQLATLRDRTAFAAWLAAIARNRAHAFMRRRVSYTQLTDVADTSGPSADARELLDAIRTLPEAYRETLLLRFVEGMTGPEIAARTGLAEGSVRVNLHRGMKMLREHVRMSGTRRACDD